MVKQKGVDLSSIPWSGAHRTRPGIKLPGAERLATAACKFVARLRVAKILSKGLAPVGVSHQLIKARGLAMHGNPRPRPRCYPGPVAAAMRDSHPRLPRAG